MHPSVVALPRHQQIISKMFRRNQLFSFSPARLEYVRRRVLGSPLTRSANSAHRPMHCGSLSSPVHLISSKSRIPLNKSPICLIRSKNRNTHIRQCRKWPISLFPRKTHPLFLRYQLVIYFAAIYQPVSHARCFVRFPCSHFKSRHPPDQAPVGSSPEPYVRFLDLNTLRAPSLV